MSEIPATIAIGDKVKVRDTSYIYDGLIYAEWFSDYIEKTLSPEVAKNIRNGLHVTPHSFDELHGEVVASVEDPTDPSLSVCVILVGTPKYMIVGHKGLRKLA